MKRKNSATGLTNAVEPIMTYEQFTRELEYQLMMYFVKQIYKKGKLSAAEYEEHQTALIQICNPPIGRISNPKRPIRMLTVKDAGERIEDQAIVSNPSHGIA